MNNVACERPSYHFRSVFEDLSYHQVSIVRYSTHRSAYTPYGLLPEKEFLLSSFRMEGFNLKSLKRGRTLIHFLRSNSGLLCKCLSLLTSIKDKISLISASYFWHIMCSLLSRAVDSTHLIVFPPFQAPSGGGLGKPPANSVEKGIVRSGSTLFVPNSNFVKKR